MRRAPNGRYGMRGGLAGREAAVADMLWPCTHPPAAWAWALGMLLLAVARSGGSQNPAAPGMARRQHQVSVGSAINAAAAAVAGAGHGRPHCASRQWFTFPRSNTIALGAAALLLLPGIFHYTYLGPSFAVTHALVKPTMRATASALLVLIMTLIGLGLGPLLVGFAGDILASHAFTAAGQGDFGALCPGGVAPAGAGEASRAACMQASATGIQRAIAGCALFYAWGGLHFALAARAMPKGT